MKKLLHALLLTAVPICLTAQVTVSTSQYTTEQLVNTVLFGNGSSSATNITSTTGTNFNSVNGLGYFQKNTSEFSFNDGIILSSGGAVNAGGPISIPSEGTFEWLGDADLQNTIAASTGAPMLSRNATVLEFDFVPFQNHISLDYMLASNEYGIYQCSFGDAIAFLLTDITTNTVVNIAVVPGSVMPVSPLTIRDQAYNSACPSSNEEYFGEYYFTDTATAPINFKGITVPMTAEASVIPFHNYHLKMVVADRNDPLFDSAIFIESGSFDIGDFSAADIQIESTTGNILCDGSMTTLSVPANDAYIYEWSYNGVALPNTSNTLDTTGPGEYTVTITMAGTTLSTTASIIIVSGGSIAEEFTLEDYIISEPDTDGFAEFDLNTISGQINAQITGNENYSTTYYTSLADAQFEVNQLFPLYTNISNPQTIYARIENVNGCFVTLSFTIQVVEDIPAPTGASDQTFTQGETLGDINLEGENIQWYDNSGEGLVPDGIDPLPLTTPLVDGITYYASQTIDGLESIERLAVTVHITMGIDKNIFSGLSYYPNPVKDVMNIDSTNSIDTISITNTLGQIVLSKTINSNNTQVDLSSLGSDIYFVTIASGSASKTVKIIKE